MKKLFFLLLLIGGIAAVVVFLQRRSEGTFEDTWDTFSELPGKVRDAGKSAA
jgi:hypothetical protein